MDNESFTKAVALIICLAVLAAFLTLAPIMLTLAFVPFLLMAALVAVFVGPREFLRDFWDHVNRSTSF